MPRKFPHVLIAALVLAGCATSATPATEAIAVSTDSTITALNMMPVKEWPLKFRSHSFGAWCYDTLECSVWYAGMEQGSSENPAPSSSKYGPGYLDHWSGSHSMILNFPPPAEVMWRSADGEVHRARIDIAQLFEDELILHKVTREEMADVPSGKYRHEPSILMEINDRTIRIYMRAHVPTKALRKPGNRYSDFRNDLILVKTYSY